jgi:hypothetical protein
MVTFHEWAMKAMPKRCKGRTIDEAYVLLKDLNLTGEQARKVVIHAANALIEDHFMQEDDVPAFATGKVEAAVEGFALIASNIGGAADQMMPLMKQALVDAHKAMVARSTVSVEREDSPTPKAEGAMPADLDTMIALRMQAFMDEQSKKSRAARHKLCPGCRRVETDCMCSRTDTKPKTKKKRAATPPPEPETEDEDEEEEDEEFEEEEDVEEEEEAALPKSSNAARKKTTAFDISNPKFLLDATEWHDTIANASFTEVTAAFNAYYREAAGKFPNDCAFLVELLGYAAQIMQACKGNTGAQGPLQKLITRSIARMEFFHARTTTGGAEGAAAAENALRDHGVPPHIRKARKEARKTQEESNRSAKKTTKGGKGGAKGNAKGGKGGKKSEN